MISLSKWGSMLTERDLGEIIRAAIEKEIAQSGKAVLDLSGVDMINSSFADEVFGKIIFKLGFESAKEKLFIINIKGTLKVIINNAISTRMSLLV